MSIAATVKDMLTLRGYIASFGTAALAIANIVVCRLSAALTQWSKSVGLAVIQYSAHVKQSAVSGIKATWNGMSGKTVGIITFGTVLIIASYSTFTTKNPVLARYSQVIYELSLAWLAAWIFNLLIVDLPRRQDRRRIYSGVGWMVNQIAWSGMSMIEGLSLPAGVDIRLDSRVGGAINEADRSACERICKAIGPDTPYPWRPGIGCWDLVVEATEQSREFHSRLQPWLATFDAEVNAAMNSVILSNLSQVCETTKQMKNSTLEVFANHIYDHWKACDDLMKLYYVKVLPYVSDPNAVSGWGSGKTLSRHDRKNRTFWTDKARDVHELLNKSRPGSADDI